MIFLLGSLLCILIIQSKFFLKFQLIVNPLQKQLVLSFGIAGIKLLGFTKTIDEVLYNSLLTKRSAFTGTAITDLKKFECTGWSVKFIVGTGDAAMSSILTGHIYWLKALFFHKILAEYINFKKPPQFEIIPDYLAENYDFNFSGIIKVKVGNIIIISGKIILQKFRRNHLWKIRQKARISKAG